MLESSDMRIVSPATLPERIKCKRIHVGGLNGFKPNVIKLSTGELLMTNFHGHYENQGNGNRCEHIMLFRSEDNGLTWSASHYDHLHGTLHGLMASTMNPVQKPANRCGDIPSSNAVVCLVRLARRRKLRCGNWRIQKQNSAIISTRIEKPCRCELHAEA